MSLFFAAVSFISISLAWFAYSGLVTTETEVNVKAWHIEFDKKDMESNKIVISLSELYPGMQTVSEHVKVKNYGDSDALISYEVSNIRILDEELDNKDKAKLEDMLAHDYPFAINMSLSEKYANAHDGVSEFEVSVSWPLDSDNDEVDGEWGNKAYEFRANEVQKNKNDNTYTVRSSISVEISLKAVQYIEESASPDPRFKLGDIVLYNYKTNSKCIEIKGDCIKGYIIDKNNTLGDANVTVLPDLFNDYTTGTASDIDTKVKELTKDWKVTSRTLKVDDVLNVISKDITGSVIVRPELSNKIIGNLDYENRIDAVKALAISGGGYFRFKNEVFPYFSSAKCYWFENEYDKNNNFAMKKVDEMFGKVYSIGKNETCNIVPVVLIAKEKIE